MSGNIYNAHKYKSQQLQIDNKSYVLKTII